MKKFFLMVSAFFVVLSAQGQHVLQSEPGFVDVASVETWFGAEPNIEVNIHGALLNLVAEASRFEDPDLATLLLKLKGISVRGFDVDGVDMQVVKSRTSEMGKKLKSDGWETIVRVRDKSESVEMYLKTIDQVIAGMVVMVIEDDNEAVFVNIVGEIDPEQIGRLGQKFNIGGIDNF